MIKSDLLFSELGEARGIMNDDTSEDEPTMEEILASIRRIISDESEDEADEAAPEEEVVPEPEPEPEPEPQPEPEPEPEPEVESDEVGQDDIDALFDAPEPEVEEDVPVFVEEEAELEEDVLDLTEFAPADAPTMPLEAVSQPIVSDTTADAANVSFAHLTDLMVSGYTGAENTLESLVREMLKPMLKAWLDTNLPKIVQDAVEREVARIARRK